MFVDPRAASTRWTPRATVSWVFYTEFIIVVFVTIAASDCCFCVFGTAKVYESVWEGTFFKMIGLGDIWAGLVISQCRAGA